MSSQAASSSPTSPGPEARRASASPSRPRRWPRTALRRGPCRRRRPRAAPRSGRTGPRWPAGSSPRSSARPRPPWPGCGPPVRPCSQRARSSRTSSVTRWTLAARSAWSPVSGSPLARRLTMLSQSHRLGAEAAVPVRVDQPGQFRGEPGRAVGGQRHHLVLVAGVQEAEVAGGLLVEQPQRMRQRLAGQHVQPSAGVPAGQVGCGLSPPVADQHARVAQRCRPGRRTPRGRRGGARSGPTAGSTPGQRLGDEAGRLLRVRDPQVIPGIVQPHRLGGTALGGVVGVGHRVEVGRIQPGLRAGTRRRPAPAAPRRRTEPDACRACAG